jgi:hypothetical protein
MFDEGIRRALRAYTKTDKYLVSMLVGDAGGSKVAL